MTIFSPPRQFIAPQTEKVTVALSSARPALQSSVGEYASSLESRESYNRENALKNSLNTLAPKT